MNQQENIDKSLRCFRTLKPAENGFVAFCSVGEGWHNYHHVYPWDYRAAEFGTHYSLTTMLIDLLAHFGQAYDLREATYTMVRDKVAKKGDGTHEAYGKNILTQLAPAADSQRFDIKQLGINQKLANKVCPMG